MMKVKYLEWDSDFFQKKIGEISLNNYEEIEGIENYDLIFLKQLTDFDLNLAGYKLLFKETKVIFTKQLNNKCELIEEIVKDTDFNKKEADFFKELAYESGKMSRFLLDENFGTEKFKELYNKWIINSLNKKFASKIFFIEEDNKAIAFVTVQTNDAIGKIGLIATHQNYQGKGLGKKLLKTAENFCIKNGITHLEIPTQKENTQACAFYEKQGYSIKNELIIKHYWKNDTI